MVEVFSNPSAVVPSFPALAAPHQPHLPAARPRATQISCSGTNNSIYGHTPDGSHPGGNPVNSSGGGPSVQVPRMAVVMLKRGRCSQNAA